MQKEKGCLSTILGALPACDLFIFLLASKPHMDTEMVYANIASSTPECGQLEKVK